MGLIQCTKAPKHQGTLNLDTPLFAPETIRLSERRGRLEHIDPICCSGMGSSSSKEEEGAAGADFFACCNARKLDKETERLKDVGLSCCQRDVRKGMGKPRRDALPPSVQNDLWESGAGGGTFTGQSSTASLPPPQRAEARVKRSVVIGKDQGAGDVADKPNNLEEPEKVIVHRPSEVKYFGRSGFPDLYQMGRMRNPSPGFNSLDSRLEPRAGKLVSDGA